MELDLKTLRKGYIKMRAIAHPLRIRILQFIDTKKECNVNMIYRTLRLEQSVTSQHLKILRDAGLVKSRRDGKKIYYVVSYSRVKQMMDVAERL